MRFELGKITDRWLLGDSAYPLLKPWLLTPINNPTNDAERAYNRANKTTRSTCERGFGIWKLRWRCLHKSGGYLHFVPMRCVKVIVATAILHNICIENRLPSPNVLPDDYAMPTMTLQMKTMIFLIRTIQ